MDTSAYLHSQGWHGPGHALHHSGRGITKPIIIPQKTNVLGVGKKKHDAHADQWWARAFDDTLKGINATKDGVTGRVESVDLGKGRGVEALRMVGKKAHERWVGGGGLYGCFVRGERLGGTLTPGEESGSGDGSGGEVKVEESGARKRKRILGGEEEGQASGKKMKKDKKNRRRDDAATSGHEVANGGFARDGEGLDGFGEEETREERRQRRREKKAKKALEVGGRDLALRDRTETGAVEDMSRSEKPKTKKSTWQTVDDIGAVKPADEEATLRENTKAPKKNKKRKAVVGEEG